MQALFCTGIAFLPRSMVVQFGKRMVPFDEILLFCFSDLSENAFFQIKITSKLRHLTFHTEQTKPRPLSKDTIETKDL
jgi:imidazoleglycerol phosphate dehydratase HisB